MKPEKITEGKPLEAWRQQLLDAAAYMEEHGHCKGNSYMDDGRVCVIGALIKTSVDGVAHRDTQRRIESHLRLGPAYGPLVPVAAWNDRPETTKEMAVNALIGAALS